MASAPKIENPAEKGPDAIEKMNANLALEGQRRFIAQTVPLAANLKNRIEQMNQAPQLNVQRGRANANLQMQMGPNAMMLARQSAVDRMGGGGMGLDAMSKAYRAFSSQKTGLGGKIQVAADNAQQGARMGFAKNGLGLGDMVTTGLGNLGDINSREAQARLQGSIEAANRQMETNSMWGNMASRLAGTLSSGFVDAAQGSVSGAGSFGGLFGKNILLGTTGVDLDRWERAKQGGR